nr:MAG TPA: hypothetical protein [Caudoviricetes sp.]DAV57145.1 MAG TPA: hypothetical protein [Caudoviricetes sp.]
MVCPRELKKANKTRTDERMRQGFEQIRTG